MSHEARTGSGKEIPWNTVKTSLSSALWRRISDGWTRRLPGLGSHPTAKKHNRNAIDARLADLRSGRWRLNRLASIAFLPEPGRCAHPSLAAWVGLAPFHQRAENTEVNASLKAGGHSCVRRFIWQLLPVLDGIRI